MCECATLGGWECKSVVGPCLVCRRPWSIPRALLTHKERKEKYPGSVTSLLDKGYYYLFNQIFIDHLSCAEVGSQLRLLPCQGSGPALKIYFRFELELSGGAFALHGSRASKQQPHTHTKSLLQPGVTKRLKFRKLKIFRVWVRGEGYA